MEREADTPKIDTVRNHNLNFIRLQPLAVVDSEPA